MRLRFIKARLIIITALFIPAGIFAQALSFNLKEAQDYAVANSYSVRNAKYDVDLAGKKIKENLAYGFPQISGSIDYSYYLALPTSLIPGEFFGQPAGTFVELKFGTKNNFTAGATLNQLIFDGRYFIGLEYARLYEQISLQGVEKSEQDIKETVTQIYYSLLVGEEALRILDSTRSVLEKTRSETDELFKEGFAEKTDYDQLTLTVTNIENSINSVKRQNEVGYQLLNFQLGIDLDKKVTLTETLDDLITQASVAALADQPFNLEQHIDYKLISSQEQMKVLSLKNEKAAYYPSLNGFLYIQENAQRNSFDFYETEKPWFLMSSTGISMQIPIFSSGQRKSRVDQAKIDLEKTQNTKDQVAESLKLSIAQSRSEFKTALENYFREKQSVNLSLEIYKKTLVKYKEGVASSIELTQQHNQFFDSERKYFQTVATLLDAKNKLDKDLGNY
jgi:outer membrane protein TolC